MGVRRAVMGLILLALVGVIATPALAHIPTDSRGDETAQAWNSFHAATAAVAHQAAEPPILPTPRASCGAGSNPEPGMQGRMAREDVDSGRAAKGYWCNMSVVSHIGETGGFRVHRYIDPAGHECAYYDTSLLFPTNALSLSAEPTGVAVLDMSDSKHPVRTTTLVTPAMQSPHESVNISVKRGILAAVLGNPSAYPGGIDVYDISKDCRNPEPMAAAFPASPFGHESGMAPDGLTFYPTSIGTNDTTAVDLSDPRLPRQIWNGKDWGTHGMTVSDDGNRGYFAAGALVIADLSEVQARKPNPQVREISRLTWSNITIPQVAIPVTIKGKAYVVEVDEFSQGADGSSVAGHGPRVGAARIIDISDETKPRVVSNIRLEVHQPENRDAIAGDYGTQSPVQGYAGHYCNVPRRVDPGIFACSMILSGLRVFDIRDPEKPKEIAYFMAPPSTISATGGPTIDERANWAMSQPAFAPERNEIWYSDGTSGFYALKLEDNLSGVLAGSSSPGCVENRGFKAAGVRGVRRRLRVQMTRKQKLPVRVDLYRVTRGRKVVGELRVGSVKTRSKSFTWPTRLAPGIYVARFRMYKQGRLFDLRRVVFERTRGGAVRTRPEHHRRESCKLVHTFKVERPAFGGRTRIPLRMSYRLNRTADVTVTITRGKRTVKRFVDRRRRAGRVYRHVLPLRGLRRGDYKVRIEAVAGDDEQVAATLVTRRM